MSTLGVTPTSVRAVDLEPGDTIVHDERIPIHVTAIRPAICGLVVIDYIVPFGAGARTLVADEILTVIRREQEAAH